MDALVKHKPYEKWRMATLVGVHLLFIAHFVHWKLKGRTLAPLEFNEVFYTIHQGIVTAGFVLMVVVIVATLIFGRFFCSWGCHILALQDTAGWILDKLHIKRQPIRSRTLIWVPIGVMFYLFIWPQVLQAWHGAGNQAMQVVEAGGSRWSSFTTDDMWRNLPPPGVAIFTFFVCGFLIVYLLGSRGFCFQACPYGALFGLADQVAPGRIVLTKDCSQCGLCTQVRSSDILVHRELALHGMVTNPRCLKDLDCVAVCPENAVQFGFRMPPLFRKGHPAGAYRGRFSNTMGEDIFLAGAFVVAMPIYRGLYDIVPFLLAVALALCSAYMILVAWRLVRREAFQLRGVTLKIDRSLRPGGLVLMAFATLLVVFLAHSAVVQYHTILGKAQLQRIAEGHARTEARDVEVDLAVGHYQQALMWGLWQPADRRQELASLHLLRGDEDAAVMLLRTILADEPTHVEARYRSAGIAMRRGNASEAMEHWRQALLTGRERSGGNSRELIALSALELGNAWLAMGDVKQARGSFMKGLTRIPGSVPLLVAMGDVDSRTGRTNEAIASYEEALQRGSGSAMIHNNLGALYLRAGRTEPALAHFEQLALISPEDAQVRYTVGVLLARSGDIPRATEHLRKAVDLAPHDPRASEALAMLQGRPAPMIATPARP